MGVAKKDESFSLHIPTRPETSTIITFSGIFDQILVHIQATECEAENVQVVYLLEIVGSGRMKIYTRLPGNENSNTQGARPVR